MLTVLTCLPTNVDHRSKLIIIAFVTLPSVIRSANDRSALSYLFIVVGYYCFCCAFCLCISQTSSTSSDRKVNESVCECTMFMYSDQWLELELAFHLLLSHTYYILERTSRSSKVFDFPHSFLFSEQMLNIIL